MEICDITLMGTGICKGFFGIIFVLIAIWIYGLVDKKIKIKKGNNLVKIILVIVLILSYLFIFHF